MYRYRLYRHFCLYSDTVLSPQALLWTHPAALKSGDGQSQSSSGPRGIQSETITSPSPQCSSVISLISVHVCCIKPCDLLLFLRSTWRRHRGPRLSLRSEPSTPTRRHGTKSSASCACAPPSWTCSVWPTRTLSPEPTTLCPSSSSSSSGWVLRGYA